MKILTGNQEKTATKPKKVNINVDKDPLFEKGDIVTLKEAFRDYNKDENSIYGQNFKVIVCYYSNLEDMNPCVVYLDGQASQNPFLGSHFEKIR